MDAGADGLKEPVPLVHWTAFEDGRWACGGNWPEPASRHPFRVGEGYPQVTTDPSRVTCEGCLVYCRRGRRPRRVCPVCSSDVIYPLNALVVTSEGRKAPRVASNGFECGHCDARFRVPVPGCPNSPSGRHDETWMNDGRCACGADGAAVPPGEVES